MGEGGRHRVPAQAAELTLRRQAGERLRLVFAGRLIEEKGVLSLIRALEGRTQGTPIDLDVYGWGPLKESVRAAQVNSPLLRIRFMGMVGYGAPFFEVLRGHDALVLPSVTDEQPRVLFDAYSQGLPAIASATEGIRKHHGDGTHGTAFTPGSEPELVAAIERFDSLRSDWGTMTANCMRAARDNTHEKMHSIRAEAIHGILQRAAA